MSVSGIRLPGLSTGMDTEQMVKSMLTSEQNKIDKAKQEKEKITWQQDVYREVITQIQDFNSKYYDPLSPNYLLGKKSFNTTTVNSSNNNVVSASANATNSNVNYTFEVNKLATAPSKSSSVATNGVKITTKATLGDLGLSGATSFKIGLGGSNESKEIEIDESTTVKDLMDKVKDATDGKVRVSYSEMDGSLRFESTTTGSDSKLSIINSDGSGNDALSFLGIDGGEVSGSNSNVVIKDASGNVLRVEENQKNSFTIDSVTYNINGVGSASLTATTDTKAIVDNMKEFVKDYNAIIDKVYNLVTEKVNKDYPPLTEAQKEEMSEKEIEVWEKKAKEGILRNDSEMRRFLNDMENALGMGLSKFGITSTGDYNKRGQIAFDETKFLEALREDSEGVYEAFSSTLTKSKDVVNNYVGSSSSVFLKKAGMDKTATKVNNLLSEQIRRQEDKIKTLNRKFTDKENALYAKFALLESTMSKLNSQMSYLMQ